MGGTVRVPLSWINSLSHSIPLYTSLPPTLGNQLLPTSCPPSLKQGTKDEASEERCTSSTCETTENRQITRNQFPILEPVVSTNSFLHYIISQQLFPFPIIKPCWINIAEVIKCIKMCWHHSWWVRIYYQTLKLAQSFAMEGACKCYITVVVWILLPNMAPCL